MFSWCGPYTEWIDRSNGKTMVWSPPRVIIRGWIFPSIEIGRSFCPVIESLPKAEYASRWSKLLWPSSICWIAKLLSYGLVWVRVMRLRECEQYERTYVTGISPQSTILRPELKGLTSRGTLYPPTRVKRRDPARIPAAVNALGWCQSGR
jgi:hypothetical protein